MPFVIGEVVSDQKRSDQWWMLLQAIVLVRTGNCLLKDGFTKPFFVIAVFITDQSIAKRYILYKPDKGSREVRSHACLQDIL